MKHILLILLVILSACSKSPFEIGNCLISKNSLLYETQNIYFIFAKDKRDIYYAYYVSENLFLDEQTLYPSDDNEYANISCPNGGQEPKYSYELDKLKQICKNSKEQDLPYDKGACEYISNLKNRE